MTLHDESLFADLFVLELANNHLGQLDRGLKIVRDFGAVVRANGVKAAIKLQFRDVDHFIHPDFRGNTDIRYISKTEATKLSGSEFQQLVDAVKAEGCIPMATPFDEPSVDLCVAFDMPVIKIASSDANDWPLLEKVASTRRPVIVSTGGCSEAELDAVVGFFDGRGIPLAINHCVSLYPSEDSQLEMNQIDYLKHRYPGHVIGFSTHEYHSWDASMYMSYAKGARTWERHIDIDWKGVPVSKYCSLPEQIDTWFKAYNKAREMSGGEAGHRRMTPRTEVEYLNALVRGVYARRELPAGYRITSETFERDFYLAIPLRRGQLSCRERLGGVVLARGVEADGALHLDSVDWPEPVDEARWSLIMKRGI
ncbi:MAG: N-acetylneuraminate synthase family protein [Rhodopila sp.]|nr:N-acetylneuraminate synthase family protein [Rhodopila sp.]